MTVLMEFSFVHTLQAYSEYVCQLIKRTETLMSHWAAFETDWGRYHRKIFISLHVFQSVNLFQLNTCSESTLNSTSTTVSKCFIM